MGVKTVTRTEQIWLSPNNDICTLCHLSKNLYNQANYIIKRNLDSDNPDRKWVRYGDLDRWCNIRWRSGINYERMASATND